MICIFVVTTGMFIMTFSLFNQMIICVFCVSSSRTCFFSFCDLFAGVEVSPAEIKSAVSSVIHINKEQLLEERYRVNGEMENTFTIFILFIIITIGEG